MRQQEGMSALAAKSTQDFVVKLLCALRCLSVEEITGATHDRLHRLFHQLVQVHRPMIDRLAGQPVIAHPLFHYYPVFDEGLAGAYHQGLLGYADEPRPRLTLRMTMHWAQKQFRNAPEARQAFNTLATEFLFHMNGG